VNLIFALTLRGTVIRWKISQHSEEAQELLLSLLSVHKFSDARHIEIHIIEILVSG
jgi:hypothetical protein